MWNVGAFSSYKNVEISNCRVQLSLQSQQPYQSLFGVVQNVCIVFKPVKQDLLKSSVGGGEVLNKISTSVIPPGV